MLGFPNQCRATHSIGTCGGADELCILNKKGNSKPPKASLIKFSAPMQYPQRGDAPVDGPSDERQMTEVPSRTQVRGWLYFSLAESTCSRLLRFRVGARRVTTTAQLPRRVRKYMSHPWVCTTHEMGTPAHAAPRYDTHPRKPCALDTPDLDTTSAPHRPMIIWGPYSAAPTEAMDSHCTHPMLGHFQNPNSAAHSASVKPTTTLTRRPTVPTLLSLACLRMRASDRAPAEREPRRPPSSSPDTRTAASAAGTAFSRIRYSSDQLVTDCRITYTQK
mmetsp:Transcript_12535/g.37651  ORF Transcript_12535/g.37651 Transcript_12535/m.37651 type:complete len:276 (+) Transcript_12535:267-1094(+)